MTPTPFDSNNPNDPTNSSNTPRTYQLGEEAQGGIVYYVDDTKEGGKVVIPDVAFVLPHLDTTWAGAVDACKNLDFRGFSDWSLPTIDELKLICAQVHLPRLQGVKGTLCWSDAAINEHNAWQMDMRSTGILHNAPKITSSIVLPIRTFSTKAAKIGDHMHGGIIYEVDETGLHGKVVTAADQGAGSSWEDAKTLCDSLEVGGFKDWSLPKPADFYELDRELGLKNMGGFDKQKTYWVDREHDESNADAFSFKRGGFYKIKKDQPRLVRAIREF